MKTYSILPTALIAAYLAASGSLSTLAVQDESPTSIPPAEASLASQGSAGEAAVDEETGEAAAERLLEQIEQAAAQMQTLRARIRYTRVQGLLGDEQQRFGDFFYAAAVEPTTDDPDAAVPARFAVKLDGLVMDDVLRTIDQWFIYDGRWLLERNHDDKTATRRELRPEGAEDDDRIALDSSSIPIPLQLKKDEVLAEYHATRLEDDTLGDWTLHHLRLTPKRDADDPNEDGPEPLDLWFDSETLLLTKVVTSDGGDAIELLFAPTEMQPNAEIAPGTFDTALPDRNDGWSVQEIRLE